MSDDLPIQILRADSVRLFLAVVVTVSGAGASLLWLLRSKRRQFALLYFGVASFMYGVRLIVTSKTIEYLSPQHKLLWLRMDWVITCLILFPFILFFVETVTPQWRAMARWLLIAGAVVQTVVLADRFFGNKSGLANKLNSAVVLVLMPLLLFMLFVPRRKGSPDLWVVRTGAIVFALFAFYTNAVGLKLIGGDSSLEYLGFVFFL